jgi:hypothetical protein
MRPHRQLTWPGYLVAVSLVAIPLLDAVLDLARSHGSGGPTRAILVATASSTLLLPSAGVLLALVVAVLADDGRTQFAVGLVASLGTVAGVVFLMLLLLEIASGRPGEASERSALPIVVIAAKLLVETLTLGALGAAGIREARAARRARSTDAAPLLMHEPVVDRASEPSLTATHGAT